MVDFIKPARQVNRVFIHCSANSNPRWGMQELEILHIQRGFGEIGYHYFLDRAGQVLTGRSLEKHPVAQAGHNANTIAICVHGGFKNVDDFLPMQLKKLKELCEAINKAYNSNITFHGHCEVSTKPCPVFDYKKVLSLDENGKMVIEYGQCKSEFTN